MRGCRLTRPTTVEDWRIDAHNGMERRKEEEKAIVEIAQHDLVEVAGVRFDGEALNQ